MTDQAEHEDVAAVGTIVVPDGAYEAAAEAITYHPGNRTGTPEQRHPVSRMLARAAVDAAAPLVDAAVERERTRREIQRLMADAIADQITIGDLMRLPPTIDIPTACRVLKISKNVGYELAARGEFPCKVLRVGRGRIRAAYRVLTADLVRVLEVRD